MMPEPAPERTPPDDTTEDPIPCPVDHQCEESCDCWCDLHDVPIAECPTFTLVSSWLNSRDEEVERLRGQLGEASDALHAVGKAALAVAPRLRKPYSDAPETSPWTRFMEQPARRAYNLGVHIRRELKKVQRG